MTTTGEVRAKMRLARGIADNIQTLSAQGVIIPTDALQESMGLLITLLDHEFVEAENHETPP